MTPNLAEGWEQLSACPICGSENIRKFHNFDHKGLVVTYYVCECGLRFLNPRMTQARLEKYYKTGEYRMVTHHKLEPHKRDIEMQQLRGKFMADWLLKHTEGPLEVLEVGCGLGYFLQNLRAAPDREAVVRGVEWNPEQRQDALDRGLIIFEDMPTEGKYNVLALLHVLEHMNTPVEFLTDVKDILTDDAYLLLEVPHAHVFTSAYSRHHPIAYDEKTIQALLKRTGFEGIHWMKHGFPMTPVFDIFITILARRKNDGI